MYIWSLNAVTYVIVMNLGERVQRILSEANGQKHSWSILSLSSLIFETNYLPKHNSTINCSLSYSNDGDISSRKREQVIIEVCFDR